MLDKLEARTKKGAGAAADIAIVCVGLGDKDQTFAWLNKFLDERDWMALATIKPDPIWDPCARIHVTALS